MALADILPAPDASPTPNGVVTCPTVLVLKGIEGALPALVGSDASRSLPGFVRDAKNEHGQPAANIIRQPSAAGLLDLVDDAIARHQPSLITFLHDEDVESMLHVAPLILHEWRKLHPNERPRLVMLKPAVAEPGTDVHLATRHIVATLADPTIARHRAINVFPGEMMPADAAAIRAVLEACAMPHAMLPELAEDHETAKLGRGLPLMAVAAMPAAPGTLELTRTRRTAATAGGWLADVMDVPLERAGWPIGLRRCDMLVEALARLTNMPESPQLEAERSRLAIDMAQATPAFDGRRVAIYATADRAASLVSLIDELGGQPIVCATNEVVTGLAAEVNLERPQGLRACDVYENVAQGDFLRLLGEIKPDLLLAEGLSTTGRGAPWACVRTGAGEPSHLGYEGTRRLIQSMLMALTT